MRNFILILKNYVSKLKCRNLLLFCISLYRLVFSVHLGGACRFYPSCSYFAEQALRCYPLRKSLLLIIKRLAKCHFFSQSFGLDPVSYYSRNNLQVDLVRQKKVYILGSTKSKQEIIHINNNEEK